MDTWGYLLASVGLDYDEEISDSNYEYRLVICKNALCLKSGENMIYDDPLNAYYKLYLSKQRSEGFHLIQTPNGWLFKRIFRLIQMTGLEAAWKDYSAHKDFRCWQMLNHDYAIVVGKGFQMFGTQRSNGNYATLRPVIVSFDGRYYVGCSDSKLLMNTYHQLLMVEDTLSSKVWKYSKIDDSLEVDSVKHYLKYADAPIEGNIDFEDTNIKYRGALDGDSAIIITLSKTLDKDYVREQLGITSLETLHRLIVANMYYTLVDKGLIKCGVPELRAHACKDVTHSKVEVHEEPDTVLRNISSTDAVIPMEDVQIDTFDKDVLVNDVVAYLSHNKLRGYKDIAQSFVDLIQAAGHRDCYKDLSEALKLCIPDDKKL